LLQVSSWKLAREVARAGELGVISGTAMDVVVLRWLQDGDPGNLYRNALKHFPDQGMAQRFIDKYYVEGGKAADKPYKPLAMWTLDSPQELREACVLGNFCEVGSTSFVECAVLRFPSTGVEGKFTACL
jgi:NAD(P)H-dependent flavin oxidoreductase YrpB (nitropropane dioxygenase family)